MNNYESYKFNVVSDVRTVLSQANCQPILFIGSGFSKRYADAPNWDQLLKKLAELCPNVERPYGYYKQTVADLIDIGSVFAEKFQDWAWGDGRSYFPENYFQGKRAANSFIKYAVTKILRNLGEEYEAKLHKDLEREIRLLKSIRPHAVITTNYDTILENIFPNYEVIIGQKILRKPFLSIGEIFKIHGCVTDPDSLVLTREDYNEFNDDKKYLSAKLLTYFAEHPILFIGYSAQDPNIKNVLYDLSRMFRPALELSPNIYVVEWADSIQPDATPPRERVLLVGENTEVRIKSISASDFQWIYEAFGANGALEKVDLKTLRSLMARTVNLIRSDIPTRNINVNYTTLEQAVQSSENFGNLLGVTLLDGPSNINAQFPYTGTMLGQKLGYKDFNGLNQLLNLLKRQTGVDVKEFDNIYHFKLKTGAAEKSFTRKYSDATFLLLQALKNGEAVELPKSVIDAYNDLL